MIRTFRGIKHFILGNSRRIGVFTSNVAFLLKYCNNNDNIKPPQRSYMIYYKANPEGFSVSCKIHTRRFK